MQSNTISWPNRIWHRSIFSLRKTPIFPENKHGRRTRSCGVPGEAVTRSGFFFLERFLKIVFSVLQFPQRGYGEGANYQGAARGRSRVSLPSIFFFASMLTLRRRPPWCMPFRRPSSPPRRPPTGQFFFFNPRRMELYRGGGFFNETVSSLTKVIFECYLVSSINYHGL